MVIKSEKSFALVRDVSDNYHKCIKPANYTDEIDVNLAKIQHQNYCDLLRQLGLNLIYLPSDSNLPDCCFIEDTTIILGDKAIITSLGSTSRRDEIIEVEKVLKNYFKKVNKIHLPGTIEGGDVLAIEKSIFVGLSGRTNLEGIRQLKSIIQPDGFKIIPVEITNTLHLKSVCTYLGNNYVLMVPGHFDKKVFENYHILEAPKDEAYCVNCLSVNGKIIFAKGFPKTKKLLENKGFTIFELDVSEFRKGDGGLSCLSILF